jgi:hypothetical protein
MIFLTVNARRPMINETWKTDLTPSEHMWEGH